MPDVNGLEFAHLMANRAEMKAIPVILLSSSLNRDEVHEAERLGLARALSKPVKRSTLLSVIQEVMGPSDQVVESSATEIQSSLESENAPLSILIGGRQFGESKNCGSPPRAYGTSGRCCVEWT